MSDAHQFSIKEPEILLSVIVPVYNASPYLAACVNSLLTHLDPRLEVLLIDDGSTDGSDLICDSLSLKDQRVRVFHKTNEGASAARNYGIQKANGKWISFVDADDYLSRHYFDTFLQYKTDCDWIIFSLSFIDNLGNKEEKIIREEKVYSGFPEIQAGAYSLMSMDTKCEFLVFTVNKFYKRDIILKHGIRFSEGLSFREDELFALNYCLHANRLRTCSRPLYNYRNHLSGSLSHIKKSTTEYIMFSKELIRIANALTYNPLVKLEYVRALDFLLNSYQPGTDKNTLKALCLIIKNLVLNKSEFLSSLKKTSFLRLLFILPTFISSPILILYLKQIYRNNLRAENGN